MERLPQPGFRLEIVPFFPQEFVFGVNAVLFNLSNQPTVFPLPKLQTKRNPFTEIHEKHRVRTARVRAPLERRVTA